MQNVVEFVADTKLRHRRTTSCLNFNSHITNRAVTQHESVSQTIHQITTQLFVNTGLQQIVVHILDRLSDLT